MSNNLTPIDTARGLNAPARMRERMAQGRNINDNFSAGATGGFPVLSIRASKFHIRVGQDEKTITDPSTGYAAPYLDVVLVDASKQLAKTFYENAYSQGQADQPDCWSLDSVRPDPSVQRKQNPTCQDCPMNAFGSRITPDGKPAKRCTDHRRVAVTFPGELNKPEASTLLLRVPQSSLRNMSNYVQKLAGHGYEPGGCVTRVSFDSAASFPKLQFDFVGPLNDQEFSTVEQLIVNSTTKAMLKGVDLDNAAAGSNQASSVQSGLVPLPRQAPITIEQAGFAPGMLQEEEAPPAPVQQQAAPALDTIIKLPDGKLFNTVTGQYVEEAKAEPQIDPAVLVLPDGRFYNPTIGQYVYSQYVGNPLPEGSDRSSGKTFPENVTSIPATDPALNPVTKKRRRSKEEIAADAASLAESSRQQAKPAVEPAPQAAAPAGNGHAPEKPTVIAASPKLEQLLSGLAPKKEPK